MAFNNRDVLSEIRAKMGRAIDRVVDVRDFGVLFDGTDESSKMQQAINAAYDLGGWTVFHPGGTIFCQGLVGKAGVGFLGNGPRSVFKRAHGGWSYIINYDGEDCFDVSISKCAWDLHTETGYTGEDLEQGGAGDFRQAIRIRDLRTSLTDSERLTKQNNITVSDCKFFNSNKPSAGNWTLLGVAIQGCNDVHVCNNRTDGVQLNISGSSFGAHRITCHGNKCRDVQAYAISCVVSRPDSGTRFLSDIDISDNQIYGQGTRVPAIYCGVDNDASGDVEIDNVQISSNTIRAYATSSEPNFAHIFFRSGTTRANNVSIFGNTCYANAPASTPVLKSSIVAYDADIFANTIYGDFENYAITAYGASRVCDNTIIGGSRGIAMYGGFHAKGNFLSSGGQSGATPRIFFNASTSGTVRCVLLANTIDDNQCGAADFGESPFSFKIDGGGTMDVTAIGNTVIDSGNTDNSMDFHASNGAFGAVILTANHFGPAKLYKRAPSSATLSANTGAATTQPNGPNYSKAHFTAPPILPTYTVATLPSAATYRRGLIEVSDEAGGTTLAFSDGSNWRRVQDRAQVT